jgi:hypothetical protein
MRAFVTTLIIADGQAQVAALDRQRILLSGVYVYIMRLTHDLKTT